MTHRQADGRLDRDATGRGISLACVARPDEDRIPARIRVATAVGPRTAEETQTARAACQIAKRHLGGPVTRIAVARQVHGNQVVRVTCNGKRRPAPSPDPRATGPGKEDSPDSLETNVIRLGEYDGLWTSESGLCLLIRTADCAPVAIWDSVGGRLALAHSGWRGTLRNIVAETVRILQEDGANPADLSAWVGPVIMPPHFPVGEEVVAAFAHEWPEWDDCWPDGQLDIPGLLHRQSRAAGIPENQIHLSGVCTYSGPGGLPSHRREGDARTLSLYTVGMVRGEDRDRD
jgi:YfiH family protein